MEEKFEHKTFDIIYNYLFLLKKKGWIIVVSSLCIASFAFFLSKNKLAVYETKTKLRIERKISPAFSNINIHPHALDELYNTLISTELEILKSYTLAEKITQDLLARDLIFSAISEDKIAVFSPEFYKKNLSYLQTKLFQNIKGLNREKKKEIINLIEKLILNSTFKQEVFALIKENEHEQKKLLVLWNLKDKKNYEEMVNMIQKSLSVEHLPMTYIIVLTIHYHMPFGTKLIADKYVEEFIKQSEEYRKKDTAETEQFIEKQLNLYGEKLRLTEETIKNFKEKHKLISFSQETEYITKELKKYTSEIVEIGIKENTIENRLQIIKKKLEEQDKKLVSTGKTGEIWSIDQIPIIQEIKKQLEELELKKTKFLRVFTEKNPEVIAVKKEIKETEKKLNDEVNKLIDREILAVDFIYKDLTRELINLQLEILTLDIRKKTINEVIENYNKEYKFLPKNEIIMARLMRDKSINEEIYTMFLKKKEEIRITENMIRGDISVIEYSFYPKSPFGKKVKMDTIAGAIIGIILGGGFLLFLEFINDTLKSVEDIERILKLPVLGVIPLIDKKNNKIKKTSEGSKDLKLIYPFQENLILINIFRNLWTNIQLSLSKEKKQHLLLVTSCLSEEGKTTIAINIALTMAQMGNKTLLIEADLEKASFHKIFNINREPGLVDLLTEVSLLDEKTIRKSEFENLYILTAGTSFAIPAKLLASERIKELIEKLKNNYDYIIFDSSPIGMVNEILFLIPYIDGVLMVIEPEKVRREMVLFSKSLFEKVNANILGVILNKQIHNYHKYGRYKYYYSYLERKRK